MNAVKMLKSNYRNMELTNFITTLKDAGYGFADVQKPHRKRITLYGTRLASNWSQGTVLGSYCQT